MQQKISCMGIVLLKELKADKPKVLVMEKESEWVFPKGHLLAGENYVETACREVKEETGITVTPGDSKGQIDKFSFYYEGEKAEKVIYVFLFVVDRYQPIQPKAEEGFSRGLWLTGSEGLERLSHNDAREALKKALEIVDRI